MKKVLAVILVAVLALSLVACGGKKDCTGSWTADEVEGMKMADLVALYEAMGADASAAEITLKVTSDKATITAAGEASDIKIRLTDNGFESIDDNSAAKGVYDAAKDTLTITEGGSTMVFIRK